MRPVGTSVYSDICSCKSGAACIKAPGTKPSSNSCGRGCGCGIYSLRQADPADGKCSDKVLASLCVVCRHQEGEDTKGFFVLRQNTSAWTMHAHSSTIPTLLSTDISFAALQHADLCQASKRAGAEVLPCMVCPILNQTSSPCRSQVGSRAGELGQHVQIP